jgi:integrase
MASIERRTTTAGENRYDVRYRLPDGSPRTRTFPTRRLANNFAATVEADKLRGEWIDPRSAKVTLKEYAEQWRTARVHRSSTQAQVETHLRRHVYPHLGDRRLGSIRPSEVQAWVQQRSQELAPTTVVVIFRYVASIFRSAVADRIIPRSPCEAVKLPRAQRPRVVPLETVQVLALAEAIDPRYLALVLLGAGAGLRQGEAFGLTVDRVDFLGRRLEVTRQLLLLPREAPKLAPPKTPASRRSIPLGKVVVDELAAHLARWPAGEEGFIFTDDQGRPISRTRFSTYVWRPAVGAAEGVPAGVGFHALRHYYASLLISAGESVKVVQERLGHANASETLDTYSHLWPSSEEHTRSAVDLALGGAASSDTASRPAADSRP